MPSLKFYCPVHKLMFVCDSHCCEKPPIGVPLSKRSVRKPAKFEPYDALVKLRQLGLTFNATTITIGNKRYGKLSADEQYKRMAKDIRCHMKRYNHNDDMYYYYCFELQKNGQLHAHGIEVNTYECPFVEIFSEWGSRNTHKESFKKITNLESYYKYITKECEYPTITNLTKSRMRSILGAGAPGPGDERGAITP